MVTIEQVVEQVRSKIVRSRGTNINEQNTKAGLIDPILRALGWDVEDWEEVQREFKVHSGDNPVDYALMDRERMLPLLFIEAKALGENLDDRKWAGQIMGYAHVAGVRWVALTNGDEYRIYNAYAEGPVEQKIFRRARITDSDRKAEATLSLLSKRELEKNQIDVVWKTEFLDQKIRSTIEDLFSPEPDASLVSLIKRRVPDLNTSDIRSGLQRLKPRFDMSPGAQPAQAALRRGGAQPRLHDFPRQRARGPKREAERHFLRLRFWEGLLGRAMERGVETHRAVKPTRDSWLGAGAGRAGISLVYLIWLDKDQSGVELYIDTGDKERNKRIFDNLYARRSEIEGETHAALEWQRLNDKRASRLRLLIGQGGMRDEARWPAIQDTMVETMDSFSRALRPHIQGLQI